MSAAVPTRPDVAAMVGYHSPQVDAEVRLNTNESPFPPPEAWRSDLAAEVERVQFHRYPDRHATGLRQALAELHGVGVDEVFCANGSNEVIQSLLLAYGGPGRCAALFEPTYTLHGHIARITGTAVAAGRRTPDFKIDLAEVEAVVAEGAPTLTFLCSPNNPTGGADPPDVLEAVLTRAPGLVVVDEAYGQFSPHTALARRSGGDGARLAVVRTFSKTWAMAGARLGYLVADPEVVASCEQVTLPYHLSALTQAAGRLALRYRGDMEARVSLVATERDRLAAALADLPVTTWPSDANFILFRPGHRPAREVWEALVARSVLIRDCSTWPGVEGCLRVTVGTPSENTRFLAALDESLS
ncbi:MAG TPA: histidinol-phosphate transaminase [Acidimicrobiales bacterium]|nr:histidinol-phosphate transaminase [Acidimicrobiales bacterium]